MFILGEWPLVRLDHVTNSHSMARNLNSLVIQKDSRVKKVVFTNIPAKIEFEVIEYLKRTI